MLTSGRFWDHLGAMHDLHMKPTSVSDVMTGSVIPIYSADVTSSFLVPRVDAAIHEEDRSGKLVSLDRAANPLQASGVGTGMESEDKGVLDEQYQNTMSDVSETLLTLIEEQSLEHALLTPWPIFKLGSVADGYLFSLQ